jgi:hypothetical protein
MKKITALLILMSLSVGAAFAQKQTTAQQTDCITVSVAEMADLLIADAEKYLGRPYRWAANGPHAFDCSGFTKYIYAKFGYKLDRTVRAQMLGGRQITGGLHNLQKGDLLIYGSRKDPKRPGHVGIFIELDETNNEFTFIHAANTGVIISKSSESYYKERFLMAVRMLPDFMPSAPKSPYGEAYLDSLYSNVIVPVGPDTLKLSAGDRRIVLLEDGTWIMVGEGGEIILPSKSVNEDEVRVVYGNGTWRDVPVSQMKIPEKRYDPEAEDTPPQTAKYHTVKSGDTLSAIAIKYNTKVSEICRLSGIKATTTLKIGMKLRVK